MVFPTRGCRTCVSRRIKCDTTQPICGRCSKADRACLWDPNDQAGFHFKSENAFAQGARRRPRASKVGGPPPITSAIAIVRQESPQPALALSLDDHAFNYWFRNYIARPEDLDESGHEYTVHLMPYYIKAKPGSCLHLAVSTLSHAVFGRSRKLPDALMRADRSYLRCLAKTQQAVSGDAYEGIDELLLTTMLMGYFENTRYNVRNDEIADRKEDAVGSRFENVFCHYEGAMGLLRVRHERHNGGDLTLDRVVRRQIIRASILRGQSVPSFLQSGESFGESGPALQIDNFMVRVAAFRSIALSFFSTNRPSLSTSTADLEAIANTGKELEDDLTKWTSSVPEEWKATKVLANTASADLNETYSGSYNTYTSHGHASLWLRHRALRLIINSIFIKFIEVRMQTGADRDHLLWKQNRMRGNLSSISSELCEDVPYFFNNSVTGQSPRGSATEEIVEQAILPKFAALLAWPLAVAVSTENVPEPQRQWLQQRLKITASCLGDSVLESVAERGEFRF